jgi:prepilin-type N-terminal cleavage/methylation domain-containing protein
MMRTPNQQSNSRAVTAAASAFTLLELLVVLAIIGILASIALPSIKGMRMSGGLAAASRQMLDDTALARRWAIQNRTTVLMVFLPPVDTATAGTFAQLSDAERNILVRGQHTSYALISVRDVGDQPGRAQPRYLKSWAALPEGFIIPDWKFTTGAGIAVTNLLTDDVTTLFAQPFFQQKVRVPTLASVNAVEVFMPYIAFGPDGSLQRFDSAAGRFVNLTEDEIIPLARGSVLIERQEINGKTVYPWKAADVVERPAGNATNNYNLVVIDHVTGRGRVVRPEIP